MGKGKGKGTLAWTVVSRIDGVEDEAEAVDKDTEVVVIVLKEVDFVA